MHKETEESTSETGPQSAKRAIAGKTAGTRAKQALAKVSDIKEGGV